MLLLCFLVLKFLLFLPQLCLLLLICFHLRLLLVAEMHILKHGPPPEALRLVGCFFLYNVSTFLNRFINGSVSLQGGSVREGLLSEQVCSQLDELVGSQLLRPAHRPLLRHHYVIFSAEV